MTDSNLSCRDATRAHRFRDPDRTKQQVEISAVITKGQRYGWTADETAEAILDVVDPPPTPGE